MELAEMAYEIAWCLVLAALIVWTIAMVDA